MRCLPALAWSAFVLAWTVACEQAPPVSQGEIVAIYRPQLPADTAAELWRQAPVFTVPLIPQDMVEPRLLETSTPVLRVQSVTDGTRATFHLQWDDPTRDDLPGMRRYPDACALQFPVQPGPDAPAPQMGEEGRPVEILYWSAFWQSAVDGRPDTIEALYPGATVDHYPFEASPLQQDPSRQEEMKALFSPARALGNLMAGPRESAVEDLLAEGPGTLHKAPRTLSQGQGHHSPRGWSVILSRPLPQGVGAGQRAQVAFAVWQGSQGEVGSRKMRSVWIPISFEGNP